MNKKPLAPELFIAFVVLAIIGAFILFAAGFSYESDSWTSVDVEPSINFHPEIAAEFLPKAGLTPGAYFQEVTVEQLSKPGYSAMVRNVSTSTRKQVFERYGIPWKDESQYETDHLISLEIGGSNAITNLWPEPYASRWGAKTKDVYENFLHREIVAGRIPLRTAQKRLANDWYENMQADMPNYVPPNQE